MPQTRAADIRFISKDVDFNCIEFLKNDFIFYFFSPLVCGHDTAEDATACMELMLWKVKEDGKLKK